MKKTRSQRLRRERAARARIRRRRRRAAAGLPSAIQALTTSALALPGIAGSAAADAPPQDYTADYSYSQYREDPLSASKLASGDRDRYEVDMHQVRLAGPLGDRIRLALDVSHETMSGASPWYVTSDSQTGELLQVMSGATIDDARTDALLKGDYYFDRSTIGLGIGTSQEKDYQSYNGVIDGTRDYNEKNTTVSGGLGFSYDLIEPTQAQGVLRVDKEDKQSVDLLLGVSQILGHNTTFQLTGNYQGQFGYLADPYKQAFIVNEGPVMDDRPDDRHRFAILARLRRHFQTVNGTFHADYNYSYDTWSLETHTFDFAWHQSLFDLLRIIPSIRYYSQSQADFYAPFYQTRRSDGFASSDYRLSPYGALSYRIRAEGRVQIYDFDIGINAGYERYESEGDLALQKVSRENPGLVSFDLWSVGINGRF